MNSAIEEAVKRAIPDAEVLVASDDGTHFTAVVVSADFEGLSLVKQHQLVMGALKDHFDTERLHALQLRTFTPDRWAAQRADPLAVV